MVSNSRLREEWTKASCLTWNTAFGHGIDDVDDQGLFASDPQDSNNFKADAATAAETSGTMFRSTPCMSCPSATGNGSWTAQKRRRRTARRRLERSSSWHSKVRRLLLPCTVRTHWDGDFTNQRPNRVVGVSQYGSGSGPDNFLNGAAYSMPAAAHSEIWDAVRFTARLTNRLTFLFSRRLA